MTRNKKRRDESKKYKVKKARLQAGTPENEKVRNHYESVTLAELQGMEAGSIITVDLGQAKIQAVKLGNNRHKQEEAFLLEERLSRNNAQVHEKTQRHQKLKPEDEYISLTAREAEKCFGVYNESFPDGTFMIRKKKPAVLVSQN